MQTLKSHDAFKLLPQAFLLVVFLQIVFSAVARVIAAGQPTTIQLIVTVASFSAFCALIPHSYFVPFSFGFSPFEFGLAVIAFFALGMNPAHTMPYMILSFCAVLGGAVLLRKIRPPR